MRVHGMRMFTLLSISALLTACAGTKDSVLPQDGPTMKAIYDAHFAAMNGATNNPARADLERRSLLDEEPGLSGFVRDSATELDTHFPRLPNPTLTMYVFPHLASGSRVPVPGYVTTFPLYDRIEVALPGEVPVHTPTQTPKARP